MSVLKALLNKQKKKKWNETEAIRKLCEKRFHNFFFHAISLNADGNAEILSRARIPWEVKDD